MIMANTHRTVRIDTDPFDSCADEGGVPPGHWRERQDRPHPKTIRQLKADRSWAVGPVLGTLAILFVACVAAAALLVPA